jgi:hypothetical protein
MTSKPESLVALAIGHSTRPTEEFVRLLQAHAVTRVVDVHTVPRSRHNPQFNRDTLPASLKTTAIGYTHMAELGGLRRATRDSINTGWRNASFRGYADYMQTAEFIEAIEGLIQLMRIFYRNFLDTSNDKLAEYISPPTGQSNHSHSCERKKSTEV